MTMEKFINTVLRLIGCWRVLNFVWAVFQPNISGVLQEQCILNSYELIVMGKLIKFNHINWKIFNSTISISIFM